MKIFLIILVVLFILAIIWRLSSKRYLLPCPSWLSLLVELDNPFAKENRSASIIEHLGIQDGMYINIADIGCGPGRLTIPLSKLVGPSGKVLAMDVQQEMLEKVRKKASSLENIELLQAGIGDGKLEKDKYDYILLVNVLGEIPNQKAALEEIFQALKPGGVLSITETIFDPHYQRQSKVEELAKSIGFKSGNFFGKWYSYTTHFTADKN